MTELVAPSAGARAISRAERDMLRVARAVVGRVDSSAVEPLLREAGWAPGLLGRDAAALLAETMSRGVVLDLVRRGGWQRSRCTEAGVVREGRLWERHDPPRMPIGAATFGLLRWLMESTLAAAPTVPLEDAGVLGLGDEVAYYLAADLLARLGLEAAIGAGLGRSRLVCLGFAAHVGSMNRVSFERLFAEDAVVVLEALGPDLARRLRAEERQRRAEPSAARIIAHDAALSGALASFVTAAVEAGRADVALFVADAAEPFVVGRTPEPELWASALDRSTPLALRSEAMRAAGTLPRAVLGLRAVADRAASTAFFDEGYAGAQLVLARLERWRVRGFRDAEAVLARLASLDAASRGERWEER